MAIDKDTAKLLPFQELSRRKRKDVKVEDIKVRVCLFAFDLLYLNGEVRVPEDLYSESTGCLTNCSAPPSLPSFPRNCLALAAEGFLRTSGIAPEAFPPCGSRVPVREVVGLRDNGRDPDLPRR